MGFPYIPPARSRPSNNTLTELQKQRMELFRSALVAFASNARIGSRTDAIEGAKKALKIFDNIFCENH